MVETHFRSIQFEEKKREKTEYFMVCLATFLRTVPKKKFFKQFSGTKFYLKTELQKKFFWDMLGSQNI